MVPSRCLEPLLGSRMNRARVQVRAWQRPFRWRAVPGQCDRLRIGLCELLIQPCPLLLLPDPSPFRRGWS